MIRSSNLVTGKWWGIAFLMGNEQKIGCSHLATRMLMVKRGGWDQVLTFTAGLIIALDGGVRWHTCTYLMTYL